MQVERKVSNPRRPSRLLLGGIQWAPNIDKPKNGFDVTLHTEDIAEAKRWFDALAEGGKASMPFGETFWSPGYGGLTDKFGVPWMINTIPGKVSA